MGNTRPCRRTPAQGKMDGSRARSDISRHGRAADMQTTCDAHDHPGSRSSACCRKRCWFRTGGAHALQFHQLVTMCLCACATSCRIWRQRMRITAWFANEPACVDELCSDVGSWTLRARPMVMHPGRCIPCNHLRCRSIQASRDASACTSALRAVNVHCPARTRSTAAVYAVPSTGVPAGPNLGCHGVCVGVAAWVWFQSGVGDCRIQRRKKSSRRRLP